MSRWLWAGGRLRSLWPMEPSSRASRNERDSQSGREEGEVLGQGNPVQMWQVSFDD